MSRADKRRSAKRDRLPFGFKERDVRGPKGAMFGATQRPFNQD